MKEENVRQDESRGCQVGRGEHWRDYAAQGVFAKEQKNQIYKYMKNLGGEGGCSKKGRQGEELEEDREI